ncbi:unnamed protein product [Effrenium voratum]|nr:unnamed protein product [Effrenium voratum]
MGPTVKLLLSLSADMHLPMDRLGSNAVMTAARFGNHEVVPLLIAGPSDLLRQNFFGGRALHVASISENPQVTRTLLQMHSDPNVATNIGCPVLCFSPQYGTDPGHIEYLLKASRNAEMEMKQKDVEVCSQDSTASGGSSKGSLSVGSASVSKFRRGGILPTAICLSKAAIGAGVLSVAAHGAEVGAVYQFTCLILGGLLTLASIRMIANASVETGCWSYEDICDELFHPSMSIFTGFINVCNCLGSAAGYLIVCGQVFQVVFQADDQARKLFVVLVGVFVCGPLALARHVGFMRHLAAISVGALLLLVGSVVWYWGEHGIDESLDVESFLLPSSGATVFTYMNSINNMVFAYNNQFNVPQLTGELTPVPSVRNMTKVALLSTSLCFLLYGSVSIFGVLAFGVADNQKDTLILDLMPARKEWHVVVSLFAVMFSVLTCFQFHVYPIRQFSAYAVRKLRGLPAKAAEEEEEVSDGCGGRSLARWLDIACALGAVAVAILIAVVVTSLRTILDFIGAFASAYISYVVPPLWILALRRKGQTFSWRAPEILFSLALLSLGVFFFVFGTYSAIKGA